jgi:hypothetical protein
MNSNKTAFHVIYNKTEKSFLGRCHELINSSLDLETRGMNAVIQLGFTGQQSSYP